METKKKKETKESDDSLMLKNMEILLLSFTNMGIDIHILLLTATCRSKQLKKLL